MNGSDLVMMYEFSFGAINRNLEDVTHEESLVRPPAGNCLNWVLGHIVFYRGSMLKLVGRRPVLEGEAAIPYQRGSQPDGTETYLDLATLRGMLADAHQELIPALSVLSVEELSRNVPQDPARPQPPSSIGNASPV